MSTDPPTRIRDEAIAWHVRLRNDAEVDWEGFAAWLESDPRHSPAYDAIALSDDDLEDVCDGPPLADVSRPAFVHARSSKRWAAGGLGLAAAAALAFVGFSALQPPAPDWYEVSTMPGRSKTIAVRGDYQIRLNGASTLRLDRHNPRYAELSAGEAMFDVVHDPDAPFELRLDGNRIVDIGTRFNVVRTGTGHRVEVAEGSVLYNPDREHITLKAGQALTSATDERRIVLSTKPVPEIGGWQRGRLSYRSAPLSMVAGDLARNLGTPVAVRAEVSDRRFTGTIEIDRNEDRMFDRLSRLLGVEARHEASGWILGPA